MISKELRLAWLLYQKALLAKRSVDSTVPIVRTVTKSTAAGGYYVVYKDGYKSFSPAEAFEGRL